MSPACYPAAAWGKAGGAYGLLRRDDAFDDRAVKALERLAATFAWQDGAASSHPDAFATWPVEGTDAAIVARLRDAGTDDRGRPHSLHIAAALVPAGEEWHLSLFDEICEPAKSRDGPSSAGTRVSFEALSHCFASQAARPGGRRVLVARPGTYRLSRPSAFDCECDPNGNARIPCGPVPGAAENGPAGARDLPPADRAGGRGSRIAKSVGAAVTLFAVVGFMGWADHERRQARSDQRQARSDQSRLKEEARRLADELRDQKVATAAARAELKEARNEVDAWTGLVREYELDGRSELADKLDELRLLRAGDSRSLILNKLDEIRRSQAELEQSSAEHTRLLNEMRALAPEIDDGPGSGATRRGPPVDQWPDWGDDVPKSQGAGELDRYGSPPLKAPVSPFR